MYVYTRKKFNSMRVISNDVRLASRLIYMYYGCMIRYDQKINR